MKKHNGWTNYATWRVMLENFDGINFVRDDVFGDSIADFADQLKGDVETRIDESVQVDGAESVYPQSTIAQDYAYAFISNVNWYEIADSINDTYELNLKK